MPSKCREPEVRFHSPMPPGYVFVPKGNIYITLNIRKRTHAAEKVLYVVLNKNKQPIGLRCPTDIYEQVESDSEATKASREKAVESRDAVVKKEFKIVLLRLFPEVPREGLEEVLGRTLEKRSGRVGRTGKLDLDEKVQLAVKAYIRHRHTDYELLLKSNISRLEARRLILPKVEEVARSWAGDTLEVTQKLGSSGKRELARFPNHAGPRKQAASAGSLKSSVSGRAGNREVIVISDDSDTEGDEPVPSVHNDLESDWEP